MSELFATGSEYQLSKLVLIKGLRRKNFQSFEIPVKKSDLIFIMSAWLLLIAACENLGGVLNRKPHKFCCRTGSEAEIVFLREMVGAHL